MSQVPIDRHVENGKPAMFGNPARIPHTGAADPHCVVVPPRYDTQPRAPTTRSGSNTTGNASGGNLFIHPASTDTSISDSPGADTRDRTNGRATSSATNTASSPVNTANGPNRNFDSNSPRARNVGSAPTGRSPSASARTNVNCSTDASSPRPSDSTPDNTSEPNTGRAGTADSLPVISVVAGNDHAASSSAPDTANDTAPAPAGASVYTTSSASPPTRTV